MVRPTTFERVYAALKEKLRRGDFRPGERLEPAQLSEQLNASVTPVRDALHRLTGERLVDAPRHEGFRAPMLSETTLRHLYAWHLDLLLLAAAKRERVALASAIPLARQPELSPQNELFLSLAASSGNPEHLLAVRSLIERLEPFQPVEDELLDAIEEETNGIAAALGNGDRKALRKSLVRYHRRRQRLVPTLLARLQD